MHLSASGLSLLKSFEGCRLKAYQDQRGVWTIGWGFTKDVRPNEEISQGYADALLEVTINFIERQVEELLATTPTQNEFDAFICLAYNIGIKAFKYSTLLKIYNMGLIKETADEFLRWNKILGIEVPGLTRRRVAEREMFLYGDRN
jgi:lysozyme